MLRATPRRLLAAPVRRTFATAAKSARKPPPPPPVAKTGPSSATSSSSTSASSSSAAAAKTRPVIHTMSVDSYSALHSSSQTSSTWSLPILTAIFVPAGFVSYLAYVYRADPVSPAVVNGPFPSPNARRRADLRCRPRFPHCAVARGLSRACFGGNRGAPRVFAPSAAPGRAAAQLLTLSPLRVLLAACPSRIPSPPSPRSAPRPLAPRFPPNRSPLPSGLALRSTFSTTTSPLFSAARRDSTPRDATPRRRRTTVSRRP